MRTFTICSQLINVGGSFSSMERGLCEREGDMESWLWLLMARYLPEERCPTGQTRRCVRIPIREGHYTHPRCSETIEMADCNISSSIIHTLILHLS